MESVACRPRLSCTPLKTVETAVYVVSVNRYLSVLRVALSPGAAGKRDSLNNAIHMRSLRQNVPTAKNLFGDLGVLSNADEPSEIYSFLLHVKNCKTSYSQKGFLLFLFCRTNAGEETRGLEKTNSQGGQKP